MTNRIAKLAGNNGFGGQEKVKEASLRDLHRARTALDEVIAKLEGASV
jgi:iron uptake system EfeUOB component EfeO/EfeM